MMKWNIQGAIFDADGTLLDSMSLWDTLGEDYLRSLGLAPRENLAETFREMSLEQSARYYQAHYGVSLSVSEIIGGINAMIARYYCDTVPLKPGAASFLRSLATWGVRMCVATASDAALIDAALTRCGVRGYFDSILTCSDVGASKESPAIYEAALVRLGTKRTETWVFEDALHALRTAKDAGFPAAAVFDASEPRQEALRAAANVYLPDWASAISTFM